MFTFAETVPDVFADTYPELIGTIAPVDGAGTVKAVAGSFEPIQQAVMNEHLLHGDGRFDGPEVNERCFGHRTLLWLMIFKEQCDSGIEPPPQRILPANEDVQ
jgi:hypothetical protein